MVHARSSHFVFSGFIGVNRAMDHWANHVSPDDNVIL